MRLVGPMWKDIEAAFDDAISRDGLSDKTIVRRVKQLLQNRLAGQDREADLVDLLADMPLPNKSTIS